MSINGMRPLKKYRVIQSYGYCGVYSDEPKKHSDTSYKDMKKCFY